jgi:hypothetical protein
MIEHDPDNLAGCNNVGRPSVVDCRAGKLCGVLSSAAEFVGAEPRFYQDELRRAAERDHGADDPGRMSARSRRLAHIAADAAPPCHHLVARASGDAPYEFAGADIVLVAEDLVR